MSDSLPLVNPLNRLAVSPDQPKHWRELDQDDIMLWPDGDWCYREELHEYHWKSDDIEILYWGTPAYEAFCETDA